MRQDTGLEGTIVLIHQSCDQMAVEAAVQEWTKTPHLQPNVQLGAAIHRMAVQLHGQLHAHIVPLAVLMAKGEIRACMTQKSPQGRQFFGPDFRPFDPVWSHPSDVSIRTGMPQLGSDGSWTEPNGLSDHFPGIFLCFYEILRFVIFFKASSSKSCFYK